MRRSLFAYLVKAFSARPLGMPIPPNWIAVAGFAALGFLNPALLIIGAGLELGYLLALGTNARFQRAVDAEEFVAQSRGAASKLQTLLQRLPGADAQRFLALQRRCAAALAETSALPEPRELLSVQTDAFNRLLWLYAQLLGARHALARVVAVQESGDPLPGATTFDAARNRRSIDDQLADLTRRLAAAEAGSDLRHSLESQRDILGQRQNVQREARDKLAFIESELGRIEQQAALVREQGLISAQAGGVSRGVDSVSDHLAQTTGWLREQQRVYAELGDVLNDTHAPMVFEPPQ
ncbi:hypothetical protein BH11PLA1_BH11PLA1_15580 [soil metagenome]